jgi:hypothetical protein
MYLYAYVVKKITFLVSNQNSNTVCDLVISDSNAQECTFALLSVNCATKDL